MAYRQYFYKLSNDLIEKVRHCKTETEFVELIKSEEPNAVEEYGGETYVPLYNLGSCVYEFGKYYGNSDEMYKHGDSLFCSDELNEQYEDYGAIVVGRSGVKCAIDFYRVQVENLFAPVETIGNILEDRWFNIREFFKTKEDICPHCGAVMDGGRDDV